MERGIQEPDAIDGMIDIANRDSTAEFEVKMLSGKIQTRDTAERLEQAIKTISDGEFIEDHRMTYSFPDNTRVNIHGVDNIHKICVSQSFKAIPVDLERKQRYFESTTGRDMVDAPEVLSKFTLRSEKHIKKDFNGDVNDQKAHIRIIHRKSYMIEGGEFRVDFSSVKSRLYKNQRLREVLKNIPSFELEIEYIPRKPARKPSEVRMSLYNIMYTILTAYLETPAILLQSEVQKYIQEFKYTGIRFYNIVSMNRSHVAKNRPYNVLKGYTVTNKADGERAGLYVARDRRLLRVTRKGEHVAWTGLVANSDKHAEDFLDGEFIEGKNLFCIFDMFRYNNKDVTPLPLFTTDEEIRSNPETSRLGCAREFVKNLAKDFNTVVPGFRIETKLFLAGDGPAMEEAIQTILDTEFEYKTDGLVFTPRSSPVAPRTEMKGNTWLRVYKWKPPQQNSIDFLLKFDSRDPEYDPIRKRMARKGTLYVSRTAGEDIVFPCETMTGEYVAPSVAPDLKRITEVSSRIPSVFQPSAPRDPQAHQIWVPVNRKNVPHDLEEDRVEDNTIVECAFDTEVGQWNIMRSRHDKTLEYLVLRSPQFVQDIWVSDYIWSLIHVPITEDMLRSIVSNPPDDTFEDDMYYKEEVNRDSITTNLRSFHNRVKESQYMNYVVPGNTIFEMAVGRAGDLHKWIKSKASKVFGIDLAAGNMFNLPKGGACMRYLKEKSKGTRNLPKVLFAEGDMTKPFEEQESKYMKIMLGTEEASTPYLKEFAGVKHWDLMACQFAIHYACKDEETFKVFVQNVKKHCKSVFFGTCMDGMAVYTALAGKDRYVLRSNGKTFVHIEKKYEDDGAWKEDFGQEIEVTLESTDKPITEYLVPFQKITEMFAEAGFSLLETKPFHDVYVAQSGIALDEPQQDYTFLHRTFAFKRNSELNEEEEPEVREEVEVEEEEEKEGDGEGEEESKVEVTLPEVDGTAPAPPPAPAAPAPAPASAPVKKIRLKKPAEEEEKTDILYFFSKEPENKEFSNFYDTVFKIEDVEYKSAEHAFQAYKAKTFGDEKNFQKIVKSKSAQSAKSFGNKIEKFDEDVWDGKKDEIMRTILRAKFSQNPESRKKLLESGDSILANADPRDQYWGIGTSATTTIAKSPSKWKGRNKLGKMLMELRNELRAEDAAEKEEASEKEAE